MISTFEREMKDPKTKHWFDKEKEKLRKEEEFHANFQKVLKAMHSTLNALKKNGD